MPMESWKCAARADDVPVPTTTASPFRDGTGVKFKFALAVSPSAIGTSSSAPSPRHGEHKNSVPVTPSKTRVVPVTAASSATLTHRDGVVDDVTPVDPTSAWARDSRTCDGSSELGRASADEFASYLEEADVLLAAIQNEEATQLQLANSAVMPRASGVS